MSYDDKFDASLDLLRRLDPRKISQNQNDICTLVQSDPSLANGDELAQDLLSSVDTPLNLVKDPVSNKDFLCCDYNRDGDSYRSPWSNKYVPAVDGEDLPPFPSSDLRQLEVKANESFDIYRDLYYGNSGVSSVYMWDTDEDETADSLRNGFAGVVLFKKEIDSGMGKWDSIHVFEVIAEGGASYSYKLTSSVILNLDHSQLGVSGNLTRQHETTKTFSQDQSVNLETFHLINLGQLVENSEYNIRNLLQEVYFDKLKDIILKDLRQVGSDVDKQLSIKQSELIEGLQQL